MQELWDEGRCALAVFVSEVQGTLGGWVGGLNHWGSCSAPVGHIFLSLLLSLPLFFP